ncbi:MAG: hypothetical protein KJT01_12465, partial [Gemmatimonadetes bacterium]|nr:hypothetical protein [Gemmatimonadota bacterium]
MRAPHPPRLRAVALGAALLLAAALAGGVRALLVTPGGEPRAAGAARWGDVNADTVVSILDAQQLARSSVGLSVANALAVAVRGDVNADGAVSIVDAQQVGRFSVGLGAAARINTPLAEGASLALVLTVLDSTVVAPLSSNGIPLPKGWLFERDLPATALWDGTRELPRVLVPLAGRHADGSLRAVLLQYQATPAQRALQLQVGVARRVADPAPWPVPAGTPPAVTYPRDLAFLLGTGIVGPTIPVADNPNAAFDAQFRAFADQHWQANGAQWEQANQYDRALNHFAYWMRSGDLAYWTRAVAIARDYRDRYLAPSGFNPSPHWMALEGVALHYWLTGDSASRLAVLRSAGRLTAAFPPAELAKVGGQYTEGRIQARVLVASLLAWELGDASDDWGGKASAYAANMAALQRTDGSYGWPNWCDHQSNAMVGLQNDALIKYYERHTATPAVVATVKRAVDYLHRVSWRPASRAFTYTDVPCTGPDDLLPMPDLNMLIVNGFAFVGRQTGD